MDHLRDFLDELRENWDDHYWWARHQALQITLLGILSGLIGLLFTWLEARVQLAARVAEVTP